MTCEYIDTHCHFDADSFAPHRAELWRDCLSSGVTTLVIPGVEPRQWLQARALSQCYAGVYYAQGIHPWWIEKLAVEDKETWLQKLSQSLDEKKCIAIGECGLDATLKTALENQKSIFELHLQLAQDLNKPVIIHSLKTHAEVLALLKKYRLPAGGVIHAFSGSLEQAQAYWQLGFYLGIGGTITYPRAAKTRRTITAMPLESLVLETDAPYMPLSGHQGQPNRPDLLPIIAQALADLRAQPLQKIAQQTRYNAQHLFGWQ